MDKNDREEFRRICFWLTELLAGTVVPHLQVKDLTMTSNPLLLARNTPFRTIDHREHEDAMPRGESCLLSFGEEIDLSEIMREWETDHEARGADAQRDFQAIESTRKFLPEQGVKGGMDMGAGNYLPPAGECYPHIAGEQVSQCDPAYEMVYVASAYSTGDESVDAILDRQAAFERELMEKIDQLLSGSFYREENGCWEWQNAVLKVVLKGEYCAYYPLFVTPRTPLGIRHMDHVSRQLFDGLAELGYKLFVRSGPWTSGSYQPSRQILSSAGK